eukprot:TRINITY_DN847_c12_g1_i1.p1 TRINITY_DN847_c12_g1~~TRINITY_DN847_c12_g1_i1.p1  ORF type:complete len:149 (+),score=31.76 TRINITY_DN847_c12_g1_i1:68-514(+)
MPRKTMKVRQKVSRSAKAGLVFPVGRFGNLLKKGRYAKRVSSTCAVYLAAVLEYTCNELLTMSSKTAYNYSKQQSIKPRHICLAVREDEDFNTLLQGVTIAGGGVVQNVHAAVSRKSSKGNTKAEVAGKKKSSAKKVSAKKESGSKSG